MCLFEKKKRKFGNILNKFLLFFAEMSGFCGEKGETYYSSFSIKKLDFES